MFDFVGNLHLSSTWQLHYNKGKCSIQSTTILKMIYDLDTYDHATCMHFPHPLNMTLSTCLQLVVPLSCHYISITFSITLQLITSCCPIKLLDHRIHWRWKSTFKVKLKVMSIVLQIQLGCTYGFAFIYLDVLYPKCIIVSLSKVNSFKPIVGLCLL
jgi:hypothetical protein